MVYSVKHQDHKLRITSYNVCYTKLLRAVKRRKVGPLETEYADYTNSAEQHRALDDILSPFIKSGIKVVRS